MIEKLLQENIREFIKEHANADEQALLLKHKTIFDVPASLVAWQISGRRKAQIKIPLYYNTQDILYPAGLSLEQSSSEETAIFKAYVLEANLKSRTTLVDLTGGFGIDTFFLSKSFEHVTCVEPNAELIEYTQHNHQLLGAENIGHVNTSAEDFLTSLSQKVDCFFIDPARRTASYKKVFRFADCEPNVIGLLPKIFSHSDYVMIKAAPLLDLLEGIRELKHVTHVWVVAVKNEVKELLFLCEKNLSIEPAISAVNLESNHEPFEFKSSDEKQTQSHFSDPLQYLYEPNASILKAGAFKLVGKHFGLAKLSANTHLYTSDTLVDTFPGRIFKVESLIKSNPKEVSAKFPDQKANVVTRNYPLTPVELKKKLNLQDGGDKYLMGCSGEKQKFLIAAERIK